MMMMMTCLPSSDSSLMDIITIDCLLNSILIDLDDEDDNVCYNGGMTELLSDSDSDSNDEWSLWGSDSDDEGADSDTESSYEYDGEVMETLKKELALLAEKTAYQKLTKKKKTAAEWKKVEANWHLGYTGNLERTASRQRNQACKRQAFCESIKTFTDLQILMMCQMFAPKPSAPPSESRNSPTPVPEHDPMPMTFHSTGLTPAEMVYYASDFSSNEEDSDVLEGSSWP